MDKSGADRVALVGNGFGNRFTGLGRFHFDFLAAQVHLDLGLWIECHVESPLKWCGVQLWHSQPRAVLRSADGRSRDRAR